MKVKSVVKVATVYHHVEADDGNLYRRSEEIGQWEKLVQGIWEPYFGLGAGLEKAFQDYMVGMPKFQIEDVRTQLCAPDAESSEYVLYIRHLPTYALDFHTLTISRLVEHLIATAQTLKRDIELNGDSEKRIADMKFSTTKQRADTSTYLAVKIRKEQK